MISIVGLLPAPTSVLDYGASSFLLAEAATTVLLPVSSALASDLTKFSSAAAVMIATTSGVAAPADGDSRPGSENGECQLLGPFALIIQGALGALALLSLVYKRWRERPQRPLKVWAFDASKQVVGSMLLHIANLLMSMLSSGQLSMNAAATNGYQANPCSFYLLNLAIDTTVGIPILIVLLRLLTHGFSLTPLGNPPESIQSGNYGQPPKSAWWLKQSFIYFLGLLGMKFCVFIIFQLCPWIVRVGDWALRWTEGNEMVQVFFVMLFFPVVMNALQYYIIDSFIKNRTPTDHERIPSDDGDAEDTDHHSDSYRRRSRTMDDDEDEFSGFEGDDEINKQGPPLKDRETEDKRPSSRGAKKTNQNPKKLDEYDPATDGERGLGANSGSQSNQEATHATNTEGKQNSETTSNPRH